MSWKSLVTAGLLCVLASPVFAASAVPQLEIISDGLDAATGNWVLYVRVAPSDGAVHQSERSYDRQSDGG